MSNITATEVLARQEHAKNNPPQELVEWVSTVQRLMMEPILERWVDVLYREAVVIPALCGPMGRVMP